MNFLNGITLLLIYQLIGEVSARLLKLPIPGPVLGMLLLFISLLIRDSLAETIETATSALLSHLSLLFVPAGVGVMVHWGRIGHDWLPITVALVLSTLLSLGLTALFMQVLIRFTAAKG
jgi:holin-like protein